MTGKKSEDEKDQDAAPTSSDEQVELGTETEPGEEEHNEEEHLEEIIDAGGWPKEANE